MNKSVKRKVGIILVVILFTTQLFGYQPSFDVKDAKAADSGFLYFGRYVQTLVKDETDIAYLSKQTYNDNKETIVNGIKIRKSGSNYYKEAPIKWRVISSSEDSYTLLSEYVLENRAYGYSFWNESELRTWLNNDFLKAAFNENEQNDIFEDEIVTQKKDYEDVYINRNDREYNVFSNDKVYLLSAEEVTSPDLGFNSDKGESDSARIALATDLVDNKNSAQNWWLRGRTFWSYGNLKEQFVGSEGKVKDWYGTYSYGVRPVIRIKKDSKNILENYIDDNKPIAPATSVPLPTNAPTAGPSLTPMPSTAPSGVPSSTPLPTISATPSSVTGIDSWGFGNSHYYYGNEGYYITKNDYNRLVKNIPNTDREQLSEITPNGIKYLYNIDRKKTLYESWDGSCFGMSVTTCLVNSGFITSGELNGSDTLKSSKSNDGTISAINYYMWQQCFRKAQSATSTFMRLSQKDQLYKLENMAIENNTTGRKPILLTFFWYDFDEHGTVIDRFGHAVVAYGAENGKWGNDNVKGLPLGKTYLKRILIYDCSQGTDDTTCLYYNDDGGWCIPSWQIQSTDYVTAKKTPQPSNNGWLGLATNQEWILNAVDYRTGNESKVPVGAEYNAEYTLIESSEDSYHISSESGEADISWQSVSNSTYRDDILVTTDLCKSDITGKNRTIAYLPVDKTYTVTKTTGDLFVHAVKDDDSYMVSADSPGQINIGEDGEMSVTTDEKATSSVSICTDDKNGIINGCDTVFVSVNDSKSISLEQKSEGVVVEGDNLNAVRVAGYENAKTVANAKVQSQKDALMISGTNSKILISEDSNGDGKYDKVIASIDKSKNKPAKVKLKKVKKIQKNNKVQLLLEWGKVKNASGYQIQIAGTKKFKNLSLYTTKKTKFKANGLQKGRSYVRVRAYIKSGKKKVFGKWSVVKSV